MRNKSTYLSHLHTVSYWYIYFEILIFNNLSYSNQCNFVYRVHTGKIYISWPCLNSLLVKHQNSNRDWGEIVPSSHNRNELRHINHPSIQRMKSEDQEVLSVLDSPRREAIV